MSFILVGAGGHAKAIAEGILANGDVIEAYVDPRDAAWLDAPRIGADDDAVTETDAAGIIGLGGVDPAGLDARLALLDRYIAAGRAFPPWVHPSATVSASAQVGDGAVVLTGAIVHPSARIGRGAIINTRAVVEHDSGIGAGSHVAPGAIVLGGCAVGECCMIGAGAVVLPGARLAARSTVAANGRYPKS